MIQRNDAVGQSQSPASKIDPDMIAMAESVPLFPAKVVAVTHASTLEAGATHGYLSAPKPLMSAAEGWQLVAGLSAAVVIALFASLLFTGLRPRPRIVRPTAV